MKTKHWLVALVGLVCLLVAIAAIPAFSHADIEPIGADLTWSYNASTGALTVSGSGSMYDLGYSEYPWDDIREQIKSVTISSGVVMKI